MSTEQQAEMMAGTVVAVLPVGELDTDQARGEYGAILNAASCQGAQLLIAEPAADQEAAIQTTRQLAQKNPDLLVVIALRGLSAQSIEAACIASDLPCVILPVQGRYALPSSALAAGALKQAGLQVELLYAPPKHPEFVRRLSRIINAARAFTRLKRSRIGIIGGLFPNLVACRYDAGALTAKWGTTLVPIPFEEILKVIQGVTQEDSGIDQIQQAILSSFRLPEIDRSALPSGAGLHLALKHIAKDRKIDGFATECWSGFPGAIGLNPCLGFIEDAYTLACEGDVLLCVSLVMSRYLTDKQAYVGDLYDVDIDGMLTLVHCGAPASLASSKADVILGRSQLALERGFDTLTCRPKLENGPVTIFRLYGPSGDHLHLSLGEILGSEQTPNLTVQVKLAGNRWEFLKHCTGNHYVVVAGDWRPEMRLLSEWLGIALVES